MEKDPNDLVVQARALLERKEELENRWACDEPRCDGLPHEGWLHRHARSTQRQPGAYDTWAIVTGRGWGKTRTGAETCKTWAQTKKRHIAVIGRNDREVRNICFEGPAGLLAVIRPKLIKAYTKSSGDTVLTLTNGSMFRAFSSHQPDNIRGYAFDGAWCDEFSSWPHQTAEDTWDNLWFALREASNARVVVTTTPRNNDHMKMLLDEATTVTRGHTKDNLANLSEKAYRTLELRYGGTRIGRQELAGELVEDVEGALWRQNDLDRGRIHPDDRQAVIDTLDRIVVGVDPPATTGTCGIVVCGIDRHGQVYVLDDYSMVDVQPNRWATAVSQASQDYGGAMVVVETNMGGRMVTAVMKAADITLPMTTVNASVGKEARATPVSILWEAEFQQAHLAGETPDKLAQLEQQMLEWVPGTFSPDRIDAMVWAVTKLRERAGHRASMVNPARSTRSIPGRGLTGRR